MMTLTRRDIQVLLDAPDTASYVVSTYVDMRVRDGFRRFAESEIRNTARAAADFLAETAASTVLESRLGAVYDAIRDADPSAQGLAVFVDKAGEARVMRLDYPVANQLVLDEEPYVLPLLERWIGEPNYLIAVVDSHQAHFFDARAGVARGVGNLARESDDPSADGNAGKFTYKKRYSKGWHERLKSADQDDFLQEVAAVISSDWDQGDSFHGVILLGQPQNTAAVRRLLHPRAQRAVVGEWVQPMTDQVHDIADDVERALEQWRAHQRRELVTELENRWKEDHLIGDGPTETLDALQQGRAERVILGADHRIQGARCVGCGYRFGAPIARCVFCGDRCRTVNAVQEILRLALRHDVPVAFLPGEGRSDPLARAGGVAVFLRAEANWAPPSLAQPS